MSVIQIDSASLLRQISCLFAVWGSTCSVYAQSVTIKGYVLSEKDKSPIDAASVVIRTPDSTVVTVGVTNENGQFQVLVPKHIDTLLVQLHHINFENYAAKVKANEVGCLYMKPLSRGLAEIVVKGHRPLVKGRDGGLSYDAKILSQQSSVHDAYAILSGVPGVIRQGQDLLLVGSPRFSIALNGEIPPIPQEHLIKMLQSMPASKVDAVEVYYNAPPRYHTNGAVINVITKETLEQDNHLQGEMYSTFYHHHYPYSKAGVNLNYLRDKLSLSMMYGYDYQKRFLTNTLTSHHTVGESVYDIEQKTKETSSYHSHIAYFNAGYKLPQGNITATYSGEYNPYIEKELEIMGNATGNNHKKLHDAMHSASLKYLNSKGFQVGMSLVNYKYDGKQDFEITSPARKSKFKSDFGQHIRTYRAYVDNAHSLPGGWQVGYGLSTSYTEEKDFQSFYASNVTDNPNISETLNEWITRAYLKADKKFSEQFNIASSMAGELSVVSGKRDYAIFPQVNATYIVNPNNVIQFMVSSNKVYPFY